MYICGMDHLPKRERVAALMEVGVSRPYAYHLLNGIRTPGLELALKIQDKLGIPVSSWKKAQPAFTDRQPNEAA